MSSQIFLFNQNYEILKNYNFLSESIGLIAEDVRIEYIKDIAKYTRKHKCLLNSSVLYYLESFSTFIIIIML